MQRDRVRGVVGSNHFVWRLCEACPDMYSMRPFIRTVLLLLDLWRQHVVLVDGPSSPGICQPTTYDGPLPETATLGVGTDGSGQMEGHSIDLGIYLAIEISPLSSLLWLPGPTLYIPGWRFLEL